MDALLQTWLMTFVLILARVSAFVITVPFFGGKHIPGLIKAGMGLALTCFWFSQSQTTSLANVMQMNNQPWLGFALAVAREVIIGSALGYVLGLFIVPFRIAGEYISQEMGLTLGTISDPTRPESTTAIGDVFETLGLILFLVHDVHHVFLAALHGSFLRQTVGSSMPDLPIARSLFAMSSATEWGILLVAPIACCLFITSLVLGLMSRAAPQLNLMSIGYALRLFVGFMAIYVLWPDIAPRMTTILQNYTSLLIGK